MHNPLSGVPVSVNGHSFERIGLCLWKSLSREVAYRLGLLLCVIGQTFKGERK